MKDSEQKRLQSLAEKKQSYKQQKNAIQQALQQIETGTNRKNKIIFNDHDIENKSNKKQKLSLFDADSENDDDQIDFKERFDGVKGQKLIELQSRFAHDSRFTMDSRFVEDEETVNEPEANLETSEENLVTEKKKQLDILATITGKRISEHNPKQTKSMLRFDPLKPDHLKFEVEIPKKDTESKKKKNDKQNKIVQEDQPETNSNNEVQQKTFYKVSSNLKDALKENNSFSLLNMFGNSSETNGNSEFYDEVTSKDTVKKKKHIGPISNPFKYDSSDSEDEALIEKKSERVTTNDKHAKNDKTINTEKFFFTPDDIRLKEGLEFIMKMENQISPDDYSNTRREVKQLIRSKIRKNKQKQRPFQKKLGGHRFLNKKRR